jgi:aryl-alcohol dehydrogenase-like predicted oxidoreductase
VAESLEHLQIDQIDLWWLDADDLLQPVASIIDTLIVHQQAGRIRYFGASNWSPARIAEAQAYAKSIGHQGFVAAQPFWGLAAPNRENATAQGYGFYYDEGFAPLHAAGMPMIPYAGQSRGFFSKLAANGVQGLSEPLAAMYLNDVNRKRARAVRAFAADCGVSINEIVLAYMLCQPNQTIPIIDATCPEQLWECAKAANVSLLTQDIAFLRAGL